MSKGLGCPVGSLLVGNSEIMKDALRIRKIFGGNMRQVGYLAAAGLFALENNMENLKEDHKKAIEIGAELAKLSIIKTVEPIETNIVVFQLNDDVDENLFMTLLANKNIHIISMGSRKLRMATHLDYTDIMHERLIYELKSL